MNFVKLHALGNDFVFWGSPTCKELPDADAIKHVCDRHFGIGADGAVIISHSEKYDYFMHIYNPDGFEAEMCGNALRCSAKYVHDLGFFDKNDYVAETKSGTRRLSIKNDIVTAEIGNPKIIDKGSFTIDGTKLEYVHINIGNPHCVILSGIPNDDDFTRLGAAIERHPLFPEGTNVQFVNYCGNNIIEMRVWERGIGETLSCLTGSCAVVCAVADMFKSSGIFTVKQRGGSVIIEMKNCGNMFASGKCTSVFKGQLL